MTPKQIRILIRRQMLRYSFIGITAGILTGAAFSLFLVPKAMEIMGGTNSIMPLKISFNPLIYICTILFALLTIEISMRKPVRIAGSVSPAEAMKYTGIYEKKGKGSRNIKKGGKINRMAFYNVFRDRRKAVLVICSLFMGTITILGINGLLNSVNIDNYIVKYNKYNSEYLANIDVCHGGSIPFDNIFVETLKENEKIDSVEVMYRDYIQVKFDEEVLEPALRDEYLRYGTDSNASYEDYLQKIKSYDSNFYELATGLTESVTEPVGLVVKTN